MHGRLLMVVFALALAAFFGLAAFRVMESVSAAVSVLP